jgi:hypothetical protein
LGIESKVPFWLSASNKLILVPIFDNCSPVGTSSEPYIDIVPPIAKYLGFKASPSPDGDFKFTWILNLLDINYLIIFLVGNF